jgi:tetratricopeptide (TPR) repeat protein
MKAYNHAGNHLPVRIEALLARGQAQLARQRLSAARADFEMALQLNSDANLKLTAMAHLLLVELAIAQQQPQRAYESFLQAKALIPSIRHGFILNRYRQLETKIENLQTDFIIPSYTSDLDYKRLETELQAWLLEKALREDSNLTRVAQKLNVSKKTVYLWINKYKIKT